MWVQYVILGLIIFVWRYLTFFPISTCGDGFPHWAFLNSHWSFWCTSHWSFSCITGVLDFSLFRDLSFLLVCFTGNLPWFSFTGFNQIEDPRSLDLVLLMWDHFSALVLMLNVCSEVKHSFSISLLVRSSNQGSFFNLGRFENSSASRFLFKVAISDFTYFSNSIILLLRCLSPDWYFLD